MRISLNLLLLAAAFLGSSPGISRGAQGPSPSDSAPSQVFRLSQSDVPKSLDPHRSRSSSGNFLGQQLYRNFYVYDDKKSYVPELGKSCLKENLKWTCTLKKNLTWSDGTALTAQDFVLSLRRVLTLPSPRADLLFNIKNARAVFEQKLPPDQLGVKAIDSTTFEISWSSDSPDNDVVLMSPLFVPLPKGQYKRRVFSGPYQLSDQNNQRLLLSPNLLYFKKNSRPSVEFQIFEENLAVKAYEKKQLDFLKRIPTAQIPRFEKRPDFHWYYVLRLDSIAFGPELKDKPELRKLLTHTLQFEKLQALFHSPGKVGCPGLPQEMSDEICYRPDRHLKPVPAKTKERTRLVFAYSTSGGDDHRRLAEWLQSQWQKKLNLDLILQPLENKIFQDLLEKNPPALFRKGLNLENPTCYNALEIFTTTHPDNFIHFDNKKYDDLVQKLAEATLPKAQRNLCTQALKVLMDSHVLIPTGRIHFAVMVNPQWTGWRLNELNHLDLSELQ